MTANNNMDVSPQSTGRPVLYVVALGFLALVLTTLVLLLVLFAFTSSEPHDSSPPLSTSQPSPPHPPTIDYQALVNVEMIKAKIESQQLQAAFQNSVQQLSNKYAPKFSNAATEVSTSASTYPSILRLIGYLAWDSVRNSSESDAYLLSLIEPQITPLGDEFSKEFRLEAEKLNFDLQKITVHLAANIAAIGKVESVNSNTLPPQSVLPDFNNLLKSLGWNATDNGVQIVMNGTSFIGKDMSKLFIKPIRDMSLRMFGKQIGKIVAAPAIAVATGPAAIIFDIFGAAWLAYDIHSMQADFQLKIGSLLNEKFDEVLEIKKNNSLQFASMRGVEFQKIQTQIGSQALKSLETQKIE